MNTAIDVKTTQEGGLQTTGDCPRDVSAGTWIGIPEIDAADYARQHKPKGLDSLGIDLGKNGQLQNIVLVKKADGRYECIIGNGRLEAAKKLGWTHIRADVKEGLSRTQKLMMTLAENEEREDVSPLYTGSLYKGIMEAEGIGQAVLAERLGKDQGLVSKYVSLTSLAPEVQAIMNRFIISLTHALEIAKLPKPEEQVQLAQECAEKDYSVRELQARVKQLLNPSEAKVKNAPTEKLGFHFAWKGTRITVRGSWDADGKGYSILGMELQDALAEFMQKHPASPAKEVTSAAA